jgi:crotonobetainyl-CoA:carnitine CoA-transferase CaiB-like acyl-CoA transferase
MKPLEGIKVLDLTQLLSGPTCTNMLNLLGATVVKIERPKIGDAFRDYTEHSGPPGLSMPFASCNSGKKSIGLNLQSPGAKDVIRRMAETSDIVVENFRPGVNKKLGLDWDSMRAINPKLVYCSISGFGQSGPLKDWGALDQVVQAMSGILMLNGEPEDGPVKVGFPLMDTFTGYLAVIAILAALRRRDLTGKGEFIDVSMMEAAMRLMGAPVATTLYSGKPPVRLGTGGYRRSATSDMYRTPDGALSLGAQSQPQFEALCRVLGVPELIADPRYANHAERVKNSEPLHIALNEAFSHQSAPDVERKLAEAGVPVAMVRDLLQAANLDHFKERPLYIETELPGYDPIKIVGAGFVLEGEEFELGPVPLCGEHTEEVLESLGYDKSEIAEMTASGVI